MSTNVLNQSPFLRTSRNFPSEAKQLTIEVDKSYIDIANAVNSRTIGIFSTNKSSVTGEAWFVNNSNGQNPGKQQTLRQVYQFTAAGSIPHGINTATITGFTRIYGTFTDGSVWYPLPFVSATGATNQVSITVTSTNIVITAGAGSPPTIQSGFVILEWLSQV